MKPILTLTSLLLLFIACKKDPEVKFHELKEGKHVTISWYHYNGLVDTRDANDNYYTNTISKVSKNQYQLTLNYSTKYEKIDSIILHEGSDRVTLSMLHRTDIVGDVLNMRFKNARTISEDSLVGEFYDAYYYDPTNRKWIPTHGTFAMKINK